MPHSLSLFLAVCVLLTGVPAAEPAEPLPAPVQAIIDGFGGELYFAARNLKSGKTLSFRANEKIQTASVIKVPIMVEVFGQALEGRLRLEEPLVYTQENRSPGAGILQDLRTELRLTVRDAVVLMIALSDNSATNMLIDRVTIEAVNRRTRALGLEQTTLFKKVYRPAPLDLPEEQARWGLGVTTADEMLKLMELIYRRQAVDGPSSEAMIEILKKQRDRDMVPRLLIGEKWEGVQVAGKTGSLNQLRNDVSIVFTPRGDLILSLFAQQSPDQRWTPDNEASLTLARLARALAELLLE